jgi:hypothetical protein
VAARLTVTERVDRVDRVDRVLLVSPPRVNFLRGNPEIATDWGGTAITAAAALVAAIVGECSFCWQRSRACRPPSAKQRLSAMRTEKQRINSSGESYSPKLADRLLDALWTKERELCEALNQYRVEIEQGPAVSVDDPALKELRRLDLAVYQDMISSLPPSVSTSSETGFATESMS